VFFFFYFLLNPQFICKLNPGKIHGVTPRYDLKSLSPPIQQKENPLYAPEVPLIKTKIKMWTKAHAKTIAKTIEVK
jgi:hypothetical protein